MPQFIAGTTILREPEYLVNTDSPEIDLTYLDLNMPGMTGFQFVGAYQNNKKSGAPYHHRDAAAHTIAAQHPALAGADGNPAENRQAADGQGR
jgi:CheY-like chemotaxis protein